MRTAKDAKFRSKWESRPRSENFRELMDLLDKIQSLDNQGFNATFVAKEVENHPYIRRALAMVKDRKRYGFDSIQIEASILAKWGVPKTLLGNLFNRTNIETSVKRFGPVATRILEAADRMEHGGYRAAGFLPRLEREVLVKARQTIHQFLVEKIWPWGPQKILYGHKLLPNGHLSVTPEGREKLEKTVELIFSGQQAKPAARAAGVPENEISSLHWSLRSPLLYGQFEYAGKTYSMIEDPVFDEGTWKCLLTILEDPDRPKKLGWGRLFKDGKQVPNPAVRPIVDEVCRLRVQERISEYETKTIRRKIQEKFNEKDLESFIRSVTRGIVHNILNDEFWKPLSDWWEKAAAVKRPHASLEEEGIENRINVQHLIEKKGPLRSGEIAQALKLHKATIIKHLRRLEADRVIVREGDRASTVYRARVAASS